MLQKKLDNCKENSRDNLRTVLQSLVNAEIGYVIFVNHFDALLKKEHKFVVEGLGTVRPKSGEI